MKPFPIEPPPSRDLIHWLHFAGPEEPEPDGFGLLTEQAELEPLLADPPPAWVEKFPHP